MSKPSLQSKKKKTARSAVTKHGLHISRSDTKQATINMRVASSRGSGRKPSMPKLPWQDKE